MEKITSVLNEAFSIIQHRGSNPSIILQELLKGKNIDYMRLEDAEKIDTLATLFVNLLVNGGARTLSNVNFLFKIADELIMNVPVEDFKMIYEDIKEGGPENKVKVLHLERLYTKYPQSAQLFITLDSKIVTKNLVFNEKLSFKELAEDLESTETDLIIVFKGNHILLYQSVCQADIDFYYYQNDAIELFAKLYFQSHGETIIINSVTSEGITFKCITGSSEKTYKYNGSKFSSNTTNRELKHLSFREFSFEKNNDSWRALKNHDSPYLLQAFHTKSTHSGDSNPLKLLKKAEILIKFRNKTYTIYYS